MSDTELLPCPFCGGKAGLAYDTGGYVVFCMVCHAQSRPNGKNGEHVDLFQAIATWNRRTPPDTGGYSEL